MNYFITVFRRFGASFAISVSAMWAVYMFFDSVEHVRIVRAYDAPYSRLFDLALAHSPTAFYQLAPLALLLSSAAVMLGIARSGELTVLLSAGQSLLRRLLPFVIFSFVVAAAVFAAGETLVPAAQARYVELVDLEIKHKNTWGDKWRMDRQWFKGPSGFWRIGGRRNNESRLSNVTLYRMDDDFSSAGILEIESLVFGIDKQWHADGVTSVYGRQSHAGAAERKPEIINLPEKPQHFQYVWRNSDEMNMGELAAAAELRRSQGLSDRAYTLALHMRPAYAFLLLLLPLLAAAIVWNRDFLLRRPGLWQGLGYALGAGLLTFFSIIAFKSAAESAFLAPHTAAFAPVLIVFSFCLCFFRRIIS